MKTKKCTGPCGLTLPTAKFYRIAPGRWHSRCKACVRTAQKTRYQRDRLDEQKREKKRIAARCHRERMLADPAARDEFLASRYESYRRYAATPKGRAAHARAHAKWLANQPGREAAR